MVPKPIALGLTLCDYVIVEERTRKVSVIGSFTGMALDHFPIVAQPFSVFAVLTDASGTGIIDLVATRSDTGVEVYSYRSQIHFPDKLVEVSYHARLRHCLFPAPGQYNFTLLVDGEWIAQRRVRIYSRESET